ncbi:hypothetical protein P43SY_011619 [Pythium insidiosum]|uniref:Uncharacterized protein n=1 Tax=Pythium insidiosum TaxID=114742 RepID=A0AAD5L9G5_PYTIN|nr:hypothetical protein P43SY_011619 [Pythium insidiosum]
MSSPGSTTIARYIARFRHERPRPREERAHEIRHEDFWWTQRSASPSPSSSPSPPRPHDSKGNLSASASLEWEHELWAELSSAASSGREPPQSTADSAAAASSAVPSPVSAPDAEPPAATEPSAFCAAAEESPAWSHDDPFAAMEESLEDPEIVIQRVRRRLGLGRQPSTVHAQDESKPQALSLADLGGELTSPDRSPWPPLELSLFAIGVSTADCPGQQASESAVSISLGVEQLSDEESKQTDEEPSHKADEALQLKETDARETDEELHEREDEGQEQVVEMDASAEAQSKADVPPCGDDASMPRRGMDQEGARSDVEAQEMTTIMASSPVRNSPDTADAAPDEVAESPGVSERHAEQPAGTDPAAEATSEREISVETAHTLDRLVSFVVHAWGDDVFPSGDEDEARSVFESVSAGAGEREGGTPEPPTPTPASDHQEQDEEQTDLEVTAADTDDMIVRLLCDRIALLEAALRRLVDKHSSSSAST